MMAGTGEDGPANPNGSFIYDTAVYYEEFDPIKADIIKCRDQLEHNKWGVSVCDPLRDLDGERMRRFKNSFYQSRHAIVFLTPSVLEYMERNEDNVVEFRMCTFLSGILESHDVKTRRKVIPVMVGGPENFRKPFLLSDFSILQPGERGFNRKLYRALSKLAGPETITQRQIRQKVDRLGRDRYTEGVVTEVAMGLEIPEEVLEDIKLEYGGHKAMLTEVLECWRLHRGPEAIPAVVDYVLQRVVDMPQEVANQPPQSMVGTRMSEEAPSMAPTMEDTTDSSPGQTVNVTDVHDSGNIVVHVGSNSVINLFQNGAEPHPNTTGPSQEPTVEAMQETDEGFEDVRQTECPSVSPETNEEVLADGVGGLNLDTQTSLEPTQGASGLTTHPKEFYSLPATRPKTTAGKGVKDRVGNWFSRLTQKSVPDNKEKKPGLLSDLKRRLSLRRGTEKRPIQRSASTPGESNNERLMMNRSTSFDSGYRTSTAASSRVQTSPVVPTKPTTNIPASEKLTEETDEELMLRSLPNPPNDRVEEKNETTKKKKAKASTPLAAT